MDKDKAQNYINKGYIINKKSGYQQIFINVFLILLTVICLLLSGSLIQLIIYILSCIFFITIIILIHKKKEFSSRFILYSISMLTIVISINYCIYASMAALKAFSGILFFSMIILQLIFIFIYYFYLKRSAKKDKKNITIQYISTSIGWIFIFIIKYSLKDVSYELRPLVISILCYSGIIFILYSVVNSALKWYFAKKYNIDNYIF